MCVLQEADHFMFCGALSFRWFLFYRVAQKMYTNFNICCLCPFKKLKLYYGNNVLYNVVYLKMSVATSNPPLPPQVTDWENGKARHVLLRCPKMVAANCPATLPKSSV